MPPGWLSENDAQRFWSKVEIKEDNECWYWKGLPSRNGYGRINIGGTIYLAHRISLILSGVTVEDIDLVLHSINCVVQAEIHFGNGRKSRLCCNPKHLRIGTAKENTEDMVELGRMKGQFQEGKTPCQNGEENPTFKLTSNDVENIKNDHRSQSKIAIAYSVHQSTISRIKNSQRRKVG